VCRVGTEKYIEFEGVESRSDAQRSKMYKRCTYVLVVVEKKVPQSKVFAGIPFHKFYVLLLLSPTNQKNYNVLLHYL